MFLVPVLDERHVLSSTRPSGPTVVGVGSPPESDGVGGIVVAKVAVGEEGDAGLREGKIIVVLLGRSEDRVLVRHEGKVGGLDGTGRDRLGTKQRMR